MKQNVKLSDHEKDLLVHTLLGEKMAVELLSQRIHDLEWHKAETDKKEKELQVLNGLYDRLVKAGQ